MIDRYAALVHCHCIPSIAWYLGTVSALEAICACQDLYLSLPGPPKPPNVRVHLFHAAGPSLHDSPLGPEVLSTKPCDRCFEGSRPIATLAGWKVLLLQKAMPLKVRGHASSLGTLTVRCACEYSHANLVLRHLVDVCVVHALVVKQHKNVRLEAEGCCTWLHVGYLIISCTGSRSPRTNEFTQACSSLSPVPFFPSKCTYLCMLLRRALRPPQSGVRSLPRAITFDLPVHVGSISRNS